MADRLPDEVLAAFDGNDLAGKVGPAYVLATTDPDFAPRPCMLSAGEILATGPRTYRLALWSGTGTAANLATGRPCVLCYVSVGTVLYIKGLPRQLPAVSGGLDRFEVAVEGVASDAHEGLPVTSPITYDCVGTSGGALLTAWERQIDLLRADL